MVKEKKPNILFLIETISRKKRLEWLRVKLGFNGVFVVDPVGRSGGLALFWKDEVQLEIQNYTRWHINVVVKLQDGRSSWKFTGFYGHPNSAKRKESWELLNHLKLYYPQAWLFAGDFNEITHQYEKYGGVLRREGQMEEFRTVLEDCNLCELSFEGPKYTWTNGKEDRDFTEERLDRAVATKELCQIFKSVKVKVLAGLSSDHKHILVECTEHDEEKIKGYRGFKFESKWMLDEECNEVIKEA
jgi:hypothetical protein